MIYAPEATRRTPRRPQKPEGWRTKEEVQQMLHDIAFVLRMTRRVKNSIVTGKPLPGERDVPTSDNHLAN